MDEQLYLNRYKIELAQVALLYIVIAWVITIPLRLTYAGVMVNSLLTIAGIVSGMLYLTLAAKKAPGHLDYVAVVNKGKLFQFRKAVWLTFALYLLAVTAYNTIKFFGSQIWYSRVAVIDGPYQLASIVVSYAAPLTLIIVPLLFNKAYELAEKYEVLK